MSTLTLVLTAVGSVLLLLFLVMKARMHAFVALMVVSIGAGLFSGMPLDKIAAHRPIRIIQPKSACICEASSI
ncbi:hypothetical protein V7P28_24330, partial [Klebsiella michiganensis]